jgi:hypothetical protein
MAVINSFNAGTQRRGGTMGYWCNDCGHWHDDDPHKLNEGKPESACSDLFGVLLGIVNTAQNNPDRCMADICNDNFAVYNVPLHAEMTDDEEWPVQITPNNNSTASMQHIPECPGKD